MRSPIMSSFVLDDATLVKMAKAMGLEIPKEPVKDERVKISSAQFEQLRKEGNLLGAGFVKAAVSSDGQMRRFGHRIWKLEKEGEQLYLKRMEGEKDEKEK